MMLHKNTMAKISIQKADEALKASYDTLDINLNTAQNRAYYAIFYMVMALAYLDDFITKSHHKLMGQFNKRYIYQERVFDKSLIKIYSTLILNRELSDYDLTAKPIKEDVLKDIEDAKTFIDTVKPYILERLEKESE
ncbi:MAG: hypothetical protein A2287_00600 [Candidatus Melainabacteria bacterium RIFOXYA12_FULL_32_12]|nr:MAG: hypothetical protein A2287_00600 [Candidatus Melainabacteria bacterium RIFOXYA12_FULL_32_12]